MRGQTTTESPTVFARGTCPSPRRTVSVSPETKNGRRGRPRSSTATACTHRGRWCASRGSAHDDVSTAAPVSAKPGAEAHGTDLRGADVRGDGRVQDEERTSGADG